MTARGLVVAAPASGSGKTVLTLGLVRALRERGHRVGVAKCGPDYIDPGYLAAACGADCVNLDPWAMRPGTLARLARGAADGNDLLVVEGAMGLFDGPPGGGGSTADVAVRLGLPVVLVVDAGAQGQSAGAVAAGFASYRHDVAIAGVILNRVASARHEALLREGLEATGIEVLGTVPRLAGLDLPSRHLGLVQAREQESLERIIAVAAAALAAHADLDRIAEVSRRPAPGPERTQPVAPLGQRTAVASDAAFGFAYPHLLSGWRSEGAEVLPFSPLAGEGPAAGADAVFLPGGYPELHAGTIAANRAFLDGVRAAAARSAFVYGECGGFMVLGEGLVDAGGQRHAMAGLLGLETSFAVRRLSLGYRRARLLADTPFGKAGAPLRGHEFHYAGIVRQTGHGLFDAADATGACLGSAGLVSGSVAGSFLHVVDSA